MRAVHIARVDRGVSVRFPDLEGDDGDVTLVFLVRVGEQDLAIDLIVAAILFGEGHLAKVRDRAGSHVQQGLFGRRNFGGGVLGWELERLAHLLLINLVVEDLAGLAQVLHLHFESGVHVMKVFDLIGSCKSCS